MTILRSCIFGALLMTPAAAMAQTIGPVDENAVTDSADSGGAEPDSAAPAKRKAFEGWTFKPRGRFLYDVANIDAPDGIVIAGIDNQSETRRARLGFSGKLPGGMGYKAEADFVDHDFVFTDIFLDYESGGLKITAGQHNNFQSLEEISSSNDTSFIERSAFTDAFGFERKLGLSFQYKKGAALWQGGVFTDNVHDLDHDGTDGISIDGRFVYAPKIAGRQWHFGTSAHWRDLGEADTSLRYRQRPLVHATDVRFINTGRLNGAKSERFFGLEAAVIDGRFHAAAETSWLQAGLAGRSDPGFFGGSIEAGYFLTKHSRKYSGGVFKAPEIKDAVGSGGIGAVQLNLRYDYLDLNSKGITGGTQNGYMASLIWTPHPYIRFMVNYAIMEYDNAAIATVTGDRNYSVNVLGARTQLSF
ncbi:MAG: porin [Blastomonas sp.]